ncbi:MAG: hypothetical protein SNJ70_03680, partial [Armatimonadota bacterium]
FARYRRRSRWPGLPTFLLQRSDSGTLYHTRDTIKMVVGCISSSGELKILEDISQKVRLAERLQETKLIQPDAQSRALDVIIGYVNKAKKLGSDSFKIIGTNVIRDAKNSQEFKKKVFESVNIPLDEASEYDEARLSYMAIALDPVLKKIKNDCATVDVGGGSTEITTAENGDKIIGFSVPIGVVRLTELFNLYDNPTKDDIERAGDYAFSMLNEKVKNIKSDNLVLIGGSAVNIGRVIKCLDSENTLDAHGVELSIDTLVELIDKFSSVSLEERKKIKGLDPSRADVIIAGAIILKASAELVDAKKLLISVRGLRHGMLYEMLGV